MDSNREPAVPDSAENSVRQSLVGKKKKKKIGISIAVPQHPQQSVSMAVQPKALELSSEKVQVTHDNAAIQPSVSATLETPE